MRAEQDPAKSAPLAPCLRLFGGFAIDRPGQSGDGLAYEKGRALLAYVAVETGIVHTRKVLAGMFWPNHAPTAALANLRLVLLNLRQTLDAAGLPLLQIDREAVRLDPAVLRRVDTALLSAALGSVGGQIPPTIDDASLRMLEAAGRLYRGELLAGFSLPECPDFEVWLQMRREAWHRDALALLEKIAQCHAVRQDFNAALPYALRCLELAPWDEDAHRRVMHLLAMNGQPGGALAQYENCCNILRSEFGVRPSEATRLLAAEIGNGGLARHLASPPADPMPSVLPLPNERRQVTILYCELQAEGNDDPDEAMDLLYPARLHWSETARRHGGHVVPTYSGGLLAYFGYPQADEHAARNAMRAALAIIRDAHAGVLARIGIHTGMVVSGGNLAVPDVVGAATAAAIRLRLLVEGGRIAVSEESRRLVAGFFAFAHFGEHKLSGIARPIDVFRLLGEGGAADRLDAAGLTPLVGREKELSLLAGLWESSRKGRHHVVLLRGEPGIGKSRLLRELRERLAGAPCTVREMRCQAEYSSTPFHPIVCMLESLIGFAEGEDGVERHARLERYVNANHPEVAVEAVPMLASFLSLPMPSPGTGIVQSPQRRRESEQTMLLRLLRSRAAQAPVLLLVEDLHWADPSTLQLLTEVIERNRDLPMLTVLTARPEFSPVWSVNQLTTIELHGLDDGQIGEIIQSVAPHLPRAVTQSLAERADGIPLFAEELARMTAGDGKEDVPATLRDLLAARLDATGDAKATAQLAATIGRSFAVDILSQASPLAPLALQQNLHALEAAGLVASRDGVVYRFRHALIRDTAYQSQTKPGRRAAHLKIAEVLRKEYGRRADCRSELVAQHLAAGGDHYQAIIHWLRAGSLAAQRAANAEAVLHFRAGLALTGQIEDSSERLQLEFDLLNGLGLAAIALEGYASAEAAEAHARALALCERHPGSPDMFRALWGLWASASSRSGYELALDLAQQLLRMAERSDDPVQLQQAHFAVGNTQFWRGEFTEARSHLEKAIGMHRASYHARHVADFGEDVRITAGAYLAWTLDFLGQPDMALTVSAESVALARRAKHPFSQAYALTFAALLNCRAGRPDEARLIAEETRRIADSHGFHLWRIGASIAAGWARTLQGEEAGLAEIRRSIDETREAMGGVSLVVLAPLADSLVRLGRGEEALATIDEALQLGEALGDHHVDAELLCQKGNALLAMSLPDRAAATACFSQALSIAIRQQAVLLEARAREGLVAARRGRHNPESVADRAKTGH